MRILHLVPATGMNATRYYLGSTKDIASRIQYFQDRMVPYEVVGLKKIAKHSIEGLRQIPLGEFSHVLVEKNNFWSVLRYIREKAPHIKIWYRGHNAEIPHRLDHFLSALPPPRLISRPRALGNIFVFGVKDVYTAPLVDNVLAICEWEQEHYWNYLCSKSAIANVPFFLPREYLSEVPKNPVKQMQCVCVTSTDPGPITHDSVRGFAKAVQALSAGSPWRFTVTGEREPWMEQLFQSCSVPVDWKWYSSPYEAMAPARAVAILSDYGRGFKTKILEALLCKARVLTTPGLFRRIPKSLQPYCVEVDLSKAGSFESALRIASEPFPSEDPNEKVRRVAYASLDRLLNLDELTSKAAHQLPAARTKWWGGHDIV